LTDKRDLGGNTSHVCIDRRRRRSLTGPAVAFAEEIVEIH